MDETRRYLRRLCELYTNGLMIFKKQFKIYKLCFVKTDTNLDNVEAVYSFECPKPKSDVAINITKVTVIY